MAKDNILATLNVADQVNKVNVTDDEAKNINECKSFSIYKT